MNIDTLEEIIDRFVPCMCGFTKGFAYDKNTKCDCDNSEAKQALNLYIEGKMKEARLDELKHIDDPANVRLWFDGFYGVEERIKELEG